MKDRIRRRFWQHVEHGQGCWTWTGPINNRGYGCLTIRVDGHRLTLAHRVSFLLDRGHLPTGLCVCHRCDNRLCVRPDHLFIGTVAENQLDMVMKGRQARRLSGEQVAAIRQARLGGMTLVAIGEHFGVNHTTVGRIVRRQTWRHA